MSELTDNEVDVLISYAKNTRSYQSMSLDRLLKRRGYLQWKDRKFESGRFELSPEGEEALLERGLM